ncbi:quorum-sensing autoinducer 2 sensor kinase/phosphatase LuxQ [Vibrio sonorensis]|uniref:quorum-sensing autoinducer 2 sensor kinase/phosphatase LuxQ n=1 Tax=Vibrio sonorensis TaxID=1004316 RepID=UPI0008DB1928|nr:quorum-sensing autoinducer 2 sensor kinase/phosphatase LuxQ [Vibrio sonorensis]
MSKIKTKRTSLVSLITRSVFVTIAILTGIVLLQNYQVNRQVVSIEVARSVQQTSSLVQEIFSFRLKSIEIQQDSYSRNPTLVTSLTSEPDELYNFFSSVDQMNPNNTPDLRFVTSHQEIIWHDHNNEFYGIDQVDLEVIANQVSHGSAWHLSQASSKLGTRYLMVRRSPIINADSGEVVGYLHIGVILNGNFALINAMLKGSNVENVFLTVGSEVIASSSKEGTSTHLAWLEEYTPEFALTENMVSKTDLSIDGVPTYLSVYTVQSNDHILSLVRSHYWWGIGALICLMIMVVYNRFWLGKRVATELDNLTEFTRQTVKNRSGVSFSGSNIEEFHTIGESFERNFKRTQEQEKQFADLFNFSLSPITLWDKSGRLIRVNPAAQHIFQIDEESTDDHEFLSKLAPQINMCSKGATLTGVNLQISNKTYRWNLSPISLNGQVSNVMAQGQDVTSFVEAERQSLVAKEAAEESARLRADFLAKMSHELRTPLNGILGVSQLLKGNLSDPDDLEHVDILCNSGEHLLAVLNDILDFSKIEQGKFHIQHSEFKISELVNAVEKIFAPLCVEKHIGFDVNTNVNDKCYANSDQVRLNQILFNLVSNAVKFTHKGKVVVNILVKETEDGNNLLVIHVADSGIGIEQKRLEQIFEPFVQAESTTTREYGGSGLGLAIVKSLVDLLEGKVTVTSQVGEGTQFHIEVPVESRLIEEGTEIEEVMIPPAELFENELNVLLVEDNRTNAFIAKAFCEKYRMKVDWVEDGYQALDYLKSNSDVDLILMDNQLPNIGGVETTQIIREDLGLDVPVYACTADGMQDTKRAFLSAGADYVLVKPLKERALNAAFVHYKSHFYHKELER